MAPQHSDGGESGANGGHSGSPGSGSGGRSPENAGSGGSQWNRPGSGAWPSDGPGPWGGRTSWTPPYGQQHSGPPAFGTQPSWGPYPQGGQYPGSPYPAPGYGGPYGQPRYVAPPKPGIVPLRPLMFGEILDGSFQVLRRNPKAMLGAALLAQALSAILVAVITAVTATSGSIEAWLESASPAEIAATGLGFFAAVMLASLLTVFISAVLQGAMVVPVARSILNRPTGFRRMWALAKSRTGALIGLAALLIAAMLLAIGLFAAVLVAVVAGTNRQSGILFLIPLIPVFIAAFAWIAVKVMVAPAAVVIEELGALAAVRRSWELTRGNWWRILGITLVVSLLVGVVSQVVMIPLSLLTGYLAEVASPHGGSGQDAGVAVAVGIATAVLSALVGALGYAFQTSVMALLYMDLRMRKDGLDITLLRMLETGADPDGVPGRNPGPTPSGYGPYGPAGGAGPNVP